MSPSLFKKTGGLGSITALSEAVMVVCNGREVSEREKHSDLLGNGTRAMDE